MSQAPHKQRGSHHAPDRSRRRSGRYLPGGSRPPAPPEGAPDDGQSRHGIGPAALPAQPLPDVTPPRPLRDIVPAQAMAHGGTIIRPGAVAWGGLRDQRDSGYSSGESIERILASAVADPGLLPALLAELAGTRLWVPLPVRRRPFTDGTAVRLPLVGYARPAPTSCPASPRCSASPRGRTTSRRTRAAGARRGVPVRRQRTAVAAGGRRPGGAARGGARGRPGQAAAGRPRPRAQPRRRARASRSTRSRVSYLARLDRRGAATLGLGHPPTEPLALLDEAPGPAAARCAPCASASRAWLSVPGRGEGLVIAVALDDPASEPARAGRHRRAADGRRVGAAARPVPGRRHLPRPPAASGRPAASPAPTSSPSGCRNTRPFYTRAGSPRHERRGGPHIMRRTMDVSSAEVARPRSCCYQRSSAAGR